MNKTYITSPGVTRLVQQWCPSVSDGHFEMRGKNWGSFTGTRERKRLAVIVEAGAIGFYGWTDIGIARYVTGVLGGTPT